MWYNANCQKRQGKHPGGCFFCTKGVSHFGGRVFPPRWRGWGRAFLGVIPIDTEKRVNWHKIRAEYIGGASQRSLAEKYGVSPTTIAKHCRREGWTAERKAAADKVTKKVIQKTADLAADNATIAAGIRRKGLMILDRLFDDFAQIPATEYRQSMENVSMVKRLRDLTAAYKDLTEDITQPEADKNGPIYELLRKLDGECGV